MLESFKEIEVVCPTCGETKSINIPESLFSQKKFGTIKIQVPVNAVCPKHQFIVFIDTKGTVRGYEKIDIGMIVAPVETEKEAAGILTLRKLIQLFGIYGVFSLMHAKIFNYTSYIIKDKGFEPTIELLNLIANRILPEKYRGHNSIYLLEVSDYSKIKLNDKDALLIDSITQKILQTPWKEKLKFEEQIVKKALEIINEEEQLRLLQQRIAIFIKEAEKAKDILEEVNEIYEEDLIEQVSREALLPRMNKNQFILIKKFIKRQFSRKLASRIKSRVEEFLSSL
ncbi:MAG: hypothetical protein ACFE8L_12910 [Candidatus Hodarchaeota archaeon]